MLAPALLCIAMCTTVYADVYLHSMRGSNNRLNGNGRERRNANRLFDSQNNNRGGYNVGPGYMYYYTGSILSIEWTNQHECGGSQSNCDLILQYMCSDNLRDGTITNTIPEYRAQCSGQNCNTDVRFGMHEDYEYYTNCKKRARNTNLFLADQELKKGSARYTRQNPQGTRRGYECPEERDYYPYWGPTPWKDIAVMTNDKTRCAYYRTESQNVKGRFYCLPPLKYRQELEKLNPHWNTEQYRIPITKDECEAFHYPADDETDRGVWTFQESFGIDPPECIESPKSRDNHNGNGPDGYPNMYNWTIPNDPNENCAIRIRYNISTNDYDPNLDADGNGEPAIIDIGPLVGLSNEDAKERGYVFEGNPTVQPLGGANGNKLGLALAINTAQYGRTFEDRSHKFEIRAATAEMEGRDVYNVAVRGKRGNIVQVYPAVEYDFVPNRLEVNVDDMIHFQWTGSDQNPQNNDGEGPRGQDRNNVVLLDAPKVAKDDPDYSEYGDLTGSYPEHLDDTTFLGLSRHDLINLAYARDECNKRPLNSERSPTPYFDMGPRAVSQVGIYNYLCTINNNFSNRSQKGKIEVKEKSQKKDAPSKDASTAEKKSEEKSKEKRGYHANNNYEYTAQMRMKK